MGTPPDFQGWYLDPLLITPILNKEELFRDPIYERVFAPLWKKANEALSKCKRLVIIGYSFSANDFRTKKLFLESFSSSELEELIVVNPNQGAIEKAEELCHFDNPKVFPDLKSYIVHVHQRDPERLIAPRFDDQLKMYFEEGKRLVTALDGAGIPLTAAFWFLLPAPASWRLFLVSNLVESDGTGEIMSKVETMGSSMQPPIRILPNEIIAVSPGHSLVTIMKKMIQTGPSIGGVRITRSVVNDFTIEDSFVYRMQ
jgi:hypothetical protein